jgi:outer membrane protein OmpA-like peptidoglycan-associated protein
MKKICFFLVSIIGLFWGILFSQAYKPDIKAYQLSKASIYQQELLLLSETDSLCPYLIRDKMKQNIIITGAEVQELLKTQFSDGDKLFINQGSSSKLNDGQMYFILGEGKKIYNGVTGKKLGTYYVRKGIAQIICTYENKAIIQLVKVCHPVMIGDALIPYETEKQMYQKPLDFRMCKLPKSPYAGNIVHMNVYMQNERYMGGTHHLATIDIGNSAAQRGDWVLIYKDYGSNLPPVIIGTGIVIVPEKTNSTIKLIDTTIPVTIGTKVLLIQGPRRKDALTPEQKIEDEKLPIIETLEEGGPGKEKIGLELDILFDFNDATITADAKKEMEVITDFIAAHPTYDVILKGFCCSIGGVEYNLKLSQNRVENLKKYLIDTFSIKQEVIEANYYGETDAPYDNSSEEQRRKNRLVNINIQLVER